MRNNNVTNDNMPQSNDLILFAAITKYYFLKNKIYANKYPRYHTHLVELLITKSSINC